MTPGSDEWAKAVAANISLEADAKLDTIVEEAIKTYGSFGHLAQTDTIKLSLIIHEVQHKSFMLGVQMVTEMIKRTARDLEGAKVQ